MIRNYSDFMMRRWNEAGMPAKVGQTIEGPPQMALQVGWLIQTVGELRHTTLHEGRQHPDVGLLFKNWGNFFDGGNGLTIATDIVTVRDTDAGGTVTDTSTFAIVDTITSVGSRGSKPIWIVDGMAAGADTSRWRDAPVPANAGPAEPDPEPEPEPVPAVPPVDPSIYASRLDIMIALMQADAERQERIVAAIEGLRRDVLNGGKLLAQLIQSGALGGLAGGLGGLFKAAPAPLHLETLRSYNAGIHPARVPVLVEGFDREDGWRDSPRRHKGAGHGEPGAGQKTAD